MSHSAEDIADHTPYAGEKSGWRIPLLVCGIVAEPLFFAIFLIAGALRPDYDPLRHPVSSLEFGPTGWVQSINFILTGPLVVLFGIGIRSTVRKLGGGRTVPILFMLVGAGLIGAGVFAPDPLSGYPPGTPPAAVSPSLHRVLHDLFSTPVLTALPAACIILARRFAKRRRIGWAIYSGLSAAMMIILFVMSSIAFAQGSPLTPIGGLLQRLTLAAGFLWMALLGLWSLMTPTSR